MSDFECIRCGAWPAMVCSTLCRRCLDELLAEERERKSVMIPQPVETALMWAERPNGQHVHRPGAEMIDRLGIAGGGCVHNSNPKSARFCRHCGQRFGWWRRVWGWLFGCLSPSATLR